MKDEIEEQECPYLRLHGTGFLGIEIPQATPHARVSNLARMSAGFTRKEGQAIGPSCLLEAS